MKCRVWIAAVAVVSIVIALAWAMRWTLPRVTDRIVLVVPPTDKVETAAAPTPSKSSRTPRISHAPTNTPLHALPDSRTPLGEAVEILRGFAETGDSDAAVELSWRLRACTERALARSEDHEASEREMLENEDTDERFTAAQNAVRKENVQRQIDERSALRQACRALPAEMRAEWLAWIDRAAQSGNTAAMIGYARMATSEYHDAADVRAELDTAIERRDKSRAYLEEALRRGDAEALRELATAHLASAHPKIYPLDPAKAYAYAYAGTLAGISRGNDLDEKMQEAAASLDGTRLAQAESAGRRIYETCCASNAPGP